MRPVVGDEDGEQARSRCAHTLADKMLAARRLEEALAGLIDLRRFVTEFSDRIAPESTWAKTLPVWRCLPDFPPGA